MKDIKRRVLDKLDKKVNDAKEKLGKAKTPQEISEAMKELESAKKLRDRYVRENGEIFPKRNRQRKIAEILEE